MKKIISVQTQSHGKKFPTDVILSTARTSDELPALFNIEDSGFSDTKLLMVGSGFTLLEFPKELHVHMTQCDPVYASMSPPETDEKNSFDMWYSSLDTTTIHAGTLLDRLSDSTCTPQERAVFSKFVQWEKAIQQFSKKDSAQTEPLYSVEHFHSKLDSIIQGRATVSVSFLKAFFDNHNEDAFISESLPNITKKDEGYDKILISFCLGFYRIIPFEESIKNCIGLLTEKPGSELRLFPAIHGDTGEKITLSESLKTWLAEQHITVYEVPTSYAHIKADGGASLLCFVRNKDIPPQQTE